jgi:hypothetical protein
VTVTGRATVIKVVEVSIAEFGHREFAEEAKRRGYPDEGTIEELEKRHDAALRVEKQDRFNVVDRVLDEIRRGDINEAVFWLERKHRDLEKGLPR